MASILITGGAGYIGSHTLLACLEAGHQPVVLDNLCTGFRAAVPEGVPFYRGSIHDAELLSQLFARHGFESVMHFAAHLDVEESIREPEKYFYNNVEGTRVLLEACARAGTVRRFVFSSTCAIYGNPARMPVDESTPPNPVSPYGASKLAAEKLIVERCRSSKMNAALLRYFNVAGADPAGRVGPSSANATQLVKVCSEVVAGKRPRLKIFGSDYPTPDGTCVRDYIHVSDLASAHLLALDFLGGHEGAFAFNLGYGRGYSVQEVVSAMERVSGVSFVVEQAGRRPGDAAAIYADAGKACRELGFVPRFDDLEQICRSALQWEQNPKF